MELVKGTPITNFCDHKHLSVRERLELFGDVCRAVQHAHQKGIIHRDLKPSNILVAPFDGKPVVKVIDFGVAKATGQRLTDATLFTGFGAVVGTPEYMSPEQAETNNQDIDTRSDIYSLGVLLYELLTGSTPLTKHRVKAAALLEVLRVIREEEPPRPSTRLSSTEELPSVAAQRQTEPAKLTKLVRGELDWIVMKALEKDRNRRYETANGFAMDVQRYLPDEPVQACPPSAWYRFRKMVRRNKAAMIMAAMFTMALLIAVAALSVSMVLTSRAFDSEKKARIQSEANLELTRKAIDEFFTKVSQSKLLDVPGLQPLRKDLLESAVLFQLSLAEERPNDPTVRADLAAAHLRLAVLYFNVDRNDDCAASLKAGVEVVDQLRQDFPKNRELFRRLAGVFKAHRPMSAATQLPKDIPGLTRVLEKYATLWEGLAAEDPETLSFRLDLAAVYACRADLFGRSQGREKGIADCRRSIALLEELLHIKPDDPEYQALLAFAHVQSAWQFKHTGQKEELIAANERALELRERLVAKHGEVPQYRRDYLSSLSWKLVRLREQGKQKEFELLTQRRAGELEKLADEYPNVAGYRIDLAAALKDLAAIATRAGRNADAEKLLSRAWDIRVKLLVNDPQFANMDGLIDFASEAASLQRALGRLEDADMTIKRVYELEEQLAAKHAEERTQNGYRWVFVHTARIYAGYLAATGRPQESIAPLKKAVEALEKLVAEDPTHHEAWRFLADTQRTLADTYRANHRPAEAETAMHRFMELLDQGAAKLSGETDAVFFKVRGDYRASLKQWDLAIADYSKIIDLNPQRADPWVLADAWHLRAGIYIDRGKLDEGLAGLTKATELAPTNHWHWLSRAQVYARLQEWDKMVKDCTRCLELNADLAEAWQMRGNAYAALGKWDKAVIDYAKFIEFDAAACAALTKQLKAKGRPEEAATFYLKLTELEPKNIQMWISRGRAFGDLGQPDKAIADFSRAIELDATNAEAWVQRGWLFHGVGQYDKAIADATKAIELDAKSPFPWGQRGWSFHNTSQYDKAIADLTQAIKLSPNPAGPLHVRAASYAGLRQYDQSLADYSKVMELAPGDAWHWRERATIYRTIRQYDKAIADYSKAIELEPMNAEAWLLRGWSFHDSREYDKAIADLSKAIELMPK
jgi:tetratricopeptide (TPR) repeat protein